jgi:predicted nucleotidyltransferase
MILKNTKLRNKLKKIAKENKDLEDIILFGSSVRGKENPSDIDILVIFKEKINKNLEYDIRKTLEKEVRNISIISKTKKTLKDPSFDARESYLSEGISLITKEDIASTFGFSALGLFKYGTSRLKNLKKTKFYYALNGRGSEEGVAVKLGCIKLSNNILLVKRDKVEEIMIFFSSHEIDYSYMPILIPKRMNKKQILQK